MEAPNSSTLRSRIQIGAEILGIPMSGAMVRSVRSITKSDNSASIPQLVHQIIATWHNGHGVLPAWMGLGEQRFRSFLHKHSFKRNQMSLPSMNQREIPQGHTEELIDIRQLLLSFANPELPPQDLLDYADLVAVACLGSHHLFRDLGFDNRGQLSDFLLMIFPDFWQKNTKNMKWKKFIYKQLCDQDGLNLCRAPSCEVCNEFSLCFGSEE